MDVLKSFWESDWKLFEAEPELIISLVGTTTNKALVDKLVDSILKVMYFLCYKTKFFSFLNSTKYLDLSYKTYAKSLELFITKTKTHITAKFHRTDLVIL